MKEKKMSKRVLSLVLVISMLMAYVMPVGAASTNEVRFKQVDITSHRGNEVRAGK